MPKTKKENSKKDYASLALDKKEKIKDRKKEIRDNKKFTGHEMFQAYVAITGVHPFTNKPHVNKLGRVIGPQIGKGNYPKAHSFSAKLNKNKKELNDNLVATAGVFPELSEEQEDQQGKYNETHKNIIQTNAGITDLESFYRNNQGRLNEVGSIIENKVESEGNLAIYKEEIAKLENKYNELLQALEDYEKEREEIMNKRLLKSDFDLIDEQEIINSGISQEAQEWIDIMIAF